MCHVINLIVQFYFTDIRVTILKIKETTEFDLAITNTNNLNPKIPNSNILFM